jgi:hypothetical protein
MIARIEVDLVNRKITVVWELLQTAKQIVLAPEHLTEHDDFDVFSAAQIAIGALEQDSPPFRFVHGDRVEVWEILNAAEPRLLATAAVSVTPIMCGISDP